MPKNNKIILDACCGGRMFWFDKKNPNVLFIDYRKRKSGFVDVRPNFTIDPDEIVDFRKMPYTNESFKMVVWDPPHCVRQTPELGYITKKYGSLNKKTWKSDLKKGFSECWRVLEKGGVLIFKWNEAEKKLSEILPLFSVAPLFGHTTGSRSQTKWLCFMKL